MKISEIQYRDVVISEVWYNGVKLFPSEDPIGYWVHKDTGVISYFDLTSSFISNGKMSRPTWYNTASVVKIPHGVTELAGGTTTTACFYNTKNLTEIILPKTLHTIESYCFMGSKIKSIILPESITLLLAQCFYGCDDLYSVIFPQSLQTIEGSCFMACRSLESITLPKSIQTIQAQSFRSCGALSLITIQATTPPALGSNNAFIDTNALLQIKVPAESVNAYKQAPNWSYYASRISAI